ncbi:ATP-grasp domain-containing protein [Halomonas caseinilytica]|uniref:Ribosomal protein S6--L-glutamate ligase n=1 Tax=Halomonas caseinilytica TaxID=438744 RepID=A0A1M7A588_9GAMM|nr:alpha-L-glutamate ligase [Halomonas caseinilytica]SHL37887.1 ribosomal protein S6--L-glutamate ligase [Halomonas caseinilytica]
MKLITFDVFRTLGIPGVRYIKPERMFDHIEEIRQADWLLFPEYWQVNSLLYGLGARLFPSPASYHLGHDKVEQTRAFLALAPEHVPATEILGTSPASLARVEARFGYPFIAKRIKSSMGEGVRLIASRQDLLTHVAEETVLYAQQRLPIDRDLRIVLVGGELIAAYWRVTPLGGYRANVSQGGHIDHTAIPEAAIALARRLARELDIDHAGFDIAMVDGHPYVLEFNRLFGNQGIADSSKRIGAAIQRVLGIHDDDRDPDGEPPLCLTA